MTLDDEDIEAIATAVVRKIRMATEVTPEYVAANYTLAERRAHYKNRMDQQKKARNK
jgi:hypothetical protein